MAITITQITTEETPSNADITYTSVNDTAITIMSLCNYEAESVTVDIYIVPNAGTPGNGNIFIKELEITPGETYILYQGNEKILLETGDTIRVTVTNPATTLVGVTAITSYVDL